jgi:ankyrin repeat protein
MGGCVSSKSEDAVARHSQQLHQAIKTRDNAKLVRCSQLRGGDKLEPNTYNTWGMTPLHVACEMGDERSVRILLKMGAHPDIPTPDEHGCATPMLFAASHGRTDCVQVLLDGGASPDAPDCWGNTPLYKAACYNHIKVVRLLLEHGADPNKANRWGALPIQYATLQGHAQMVRLLLEWGSDPRARGEKNEPQALTAAAMRGNRECLDLLLVAGADANYSDKDNGETALFCAIKYSQHYYRDSLVNPNNHNCNRLRCIESLLNAGAILTPPCIKQLGHESHILSYDKDYLCIVAMLLKAMPLEQQKMAEYSYLHSGNLANFSPLRQIFLASAKPHDDIFDIVKLLCSIGYTPSETDVDSVYQSLTGQQLVQLEGFQRNPRSLKDLCRLKIRGQLKGNIIQSVHELPLPVMLKDYVALRSPPSYSL